MINSIYVVILHCLHLYYAVYYHDYVRGVYNCLCNAFSFSRLCHSPEGPTVDEQCSVGYYIIAYFIIHIYSLFFTFMSTRDMYCCYTLMK